MSDVKIPSIIANLQLPDELRELVVRQAFSHNLDAEKLVEAYRAVYAMGFYDGAVFVASDVRGIAYSVIARGGGA